MAKSGKKKSSRGGNTSKKAAGSKKGKKQKQSSSKASSKSSKPIIKVDPNTGDKVHIETLTLAQMKKAKSTGECPHPKSKRVLVRIASHETRHACYQEAAAAIIYWEEQLLPSYGNRKWKVSVELDEPTKRKTPLFRWYRGKLELAVLPHLLEKVPMDREVKPKGRMKIVQDREEAEQEHVPVTELTERQMSSLSEFAYECLGDEYGIPIVTIKWTSPNHEVFRQRSKAEAHAKVLVEQTLFLDKVLEGYGSRGQALRPTKCTRADALKAGRMRFLRDGLWVVGQEDMWQASRADQVEAEQEAAQLAAEQCEATKQMNKKRRASSDGSSKRRPLSALAYFLQCERANTQQKRLAELRKKRKNSPESVSFTLRQAEQELRQVWREMTKKEQNQWQRWAKKENERLEKEQAAQPQPDVSMAQSVASDSIDITSRETKQESKPLSTLNEGQNGSGGHQVTAADSTGPELTGVEEQAVPGGCEESVSQGAVDTTSTVLTAPTQAHNEAVPTKEADFGRVPASCVLGESANVASLTSHLSARVPFDPTAIKISPYPSTSKPEFLVSARTVTPEGSELEDIQSNTSLSCTGDTETLVEQAAADRSIPSVVSPAGSDEKLPALPQKRPNSNTECNQLVTKTKYKRKPRRSIVRRFAQSNLWRLPDELINLCYDACMDHYDQVMNTVKARGLNFELADGFDVLRERGRGRYDMELPVFDTPRFEFLTSLDKAPWMPLVREILGDDLVLIHKGSFLSMPGASAQVYHQDGPHLTTRTQMPCHAVNVFVPLVDLEMNNGPTEFCLGSHILGFEDYDEDSINTPTVPAGTPIIFDYRLGHRGLANRSQYCRPLLYCTYAASKDGKAFRDSVNFSRKRYHRIGEMVDKPLSRDERTKKRKLELQERAYQQQIDELIAKSAEEAAMKDNEGIGRTTETTTSFDSQCAVGGNSASSTSTTARVLPSCDTSNVAPCVAQPTGQISTTPTEDH